MCPQHLSSCTKGPGARGPTASDATTILPNYLDREFNSLDNPTACDLQQAFYFENDRTETCSLIRLLESKPVAK